MTDVFDKAGELEEFFRDMALANAKSDFSQPSLEECEECGEEIPAERQELGSITRCMGCQQRKEQRDQVMYGKR